MAYSKNRRLAEIVSDTSGNLSAAGLIVPTQSSSDNDTSAASTAFVHAHIDAVLDSAPGTLNTLNEIAAALNDDANFNTTVTNAIAAKLPLAGGTLTGALTTNGVINAGTSVNFAINTPQSMRLNIDSDDNATDQSFIIGNNQTGVNQNNVLFKVQENGRVGIGLSAPAAKLDVGGVFQFFDDTTPEIKIIDSDDSNYALLSYSDGTINLSANHGNESGGADVIKFSTGGTERARVDASGSVFVGKTSESSATDGIELNRQDVIVATRNGDSPLILNRRTSDGDIALFRKDNTTVGSIGANGGYIYVGSSDTNLRFHAGADAILPANAGGATRSAAINLGTTGARFKDGHFSGILTAHSGNFVIATDGGGSYLGKSDNATLRLITNNTTRLTIRNDGGIGIGNANAGYSSQVLSVKSAGADNVFYGESTDAKCIMSVRDNSSSTNIGYGAVGNAHVFSQDGTAIASLSTGTANKLGLAGNGTLLKLESDDSQIRMANQVIHADNSGNTHFHIRNNYGATSGLAELSLESGYISFNSGTSFTERWRVNSSGHFTPGQQHAYDVGGTNAEVRNVYAQGISFASSANIGGMTSELLDDYEEGVYTPSYTVGGGGSVSGVTSTNIGTYTKVGRMCTVSIISNYVATSGTIPTYYNVSLPFTANTNGGQQGGGFGQETGQTGAGMLIHVGNGSSNAIIWKYNGGAVPANSYFSLTFTYQTA